MTWHRSRFWRFNGAQFGLCREEPVRSSKWISCHVRAAPGMRGRGGTAAVPVARLGSKWLMGMIKFLRLGGMVLLMDLLIPRCHGFQERGMPMKEDRIQLVRAGKNKVVFLVKGPTYLVCISCTEEPYESLREQLELIYGQMILILTKSINRCFEKNLKFDMTPLLGGTDIVFLSLIHCFIWNPATFLHAYTCLPLAYATRQAACVMLPIQVVSLVGAQKSPLHPDDILLLSDFVVASESFRQV